MPTAVKCCLRCLLDDMCYAYICLNVFSSSSAAIVDDDVLPAS